MTRPKDKGGLGIKNCKCCNKALLAKRAWSFRLGSKDIWANVLRHKYSTNRSSSGHRSLVWRIPYQTKEICEKDMGWIIRNKKIINFWHENWLAPGPLQNLLHRPLLSHKFELKICDVWDAHGCWDLSKLSFPFPPHISNLISATSRPLVPILEDGIFWKPAPNGQFNSSSAYGVAFKLKSTKLHLKGWKWIWKVNTIPRVMFFIWLVCHGQLLIRTLLFKRKIISDELCPLCKTEPESLLHILRDCALVRLLWYNIGSLIPSNFFSSSNIKKWMMHLATSDFETRFHPSIFWRNIFLILCWNIWAARNNVAMEGASFLPHEILKKAQALAIEFFFSLPHKGDRPPKTTTFIGWQPPPFGFIKLNTNGFVLGNLGHTSVGGILRDSNGNWIRVFSHKLGIANSLVAELWGLRDGLLLARDLHICKLIIKIDAKSIVDLLKLVNEGITNSHPYNALINDCRSLIQDFEEAKLQQTHRESNFCANLLAKEGIKLFVLFSIFVSPSHFVVSQLLADIWGGLIPLRIVIFFVLCFVINAISLSPKTKKKSSIP